MLEYYQSSGKPTKTKKGWFSMNGSKKLVITAESIRKAVTDGAKSLTKISQAHGYKGAVSGDVSKKIRSLVPEVAELMAGTVTPAVAPVVVAELPVAAKVTLAKTCKVKPAKPAKPANAEAPAVQVGQVKGIYRGMYGAVFSQAAAAGEVKVKEFIPTLTANIMADPSNAQIVDKIRARKGDADLVAQVEKAIVFALGVIRSPKHPSNMGRSDDVSATRGNMQIVAIVG